MTQERAMETVSTTVPDTPRVFRLAYASRARPDMARGSVVSLVHHAVLRNRSDDVSGVLMSAKGVFLQWLEGPAESVCGLMSRIAADERHSDVTVLNAGWAQGRRFARWPMELSDEGLAAGCIGPVSGIAAPCDRDRAMAAFDHMTRAYRGQVAGKSAKSARPSEWSSVAAEFSDRLMSCSPDALPALPHVARTNLRARAQLIDDVCASFAQGWRDDLWSSAKVAIGLANLNGVWQRTGRVDEPAQCRHGAVIIVPPDSVEVLGAVVKADLLRDAGFSVQLVMEPDIESSFAALERSGRAPIIVTGPRVGLTGEAARSARFAELLRQRFPDRTIHLGGRASGPLCDCAERVGLPRADTGAHPAKDVEWLVMQAIATLASRR
jgi:hypothetical protein